MVAMVRLVEKWKLITVDNIKPYYWISTFGRVYSTNTNTFIVPQFNHNGYLQVGLMTNDGGRIHRKVHRLVMITFYYFPGCEMYQVNHKDTCKTNNYDYNLEWMTPKENIHHAINNNCRSDYIGENNPRATVNESQVREIYNLIISNNYSDEQIADMFNCSKDVIRNIALGNTWRNSFSEDEINNMKSTRKGFTFPENIKHNLCLYYQNHNNDYKSNYGKAKDITTKALLYNGLELTNFNIRIARRLYFKLQNPEITSLYNY